jgi:hypothetical protein
MHDDIGWIRQRASVLMAKDEDLEYDDALTLATEERIAWKERQTERVHRVKPLRVTLGDLLKAKKT